MPPQDFTNLVGGVKFDRPVDEAFPPVSYSAAGKWHAGLPRRFFAVLGGKQYQDDAGSCTAHGYPKVVESWAKKIGADFQVCRQDAYFGARFLEGNGAERRDGGAYPSYVRRWYREHGTVGEERKKYRPADVTTWRPPADWKDDRALLSHGYDPIPRTADAALFEMGSNGLPTAICHLVTDSINRVTAEGLERFVDGPVLGGHCRAAVGYDLDLFIGGAVTPSILVANSWRGFGIPHPLFATDSRFDDEPDSFSWMPLASFENPRFLQDNDRLAQPPAIKAVTA